MPELLIQDTASLTRLCEQLRGQSWLALDTEFMRSRTYYARLCLVQVAAPDVVACVDALALTTIEPLLDIIYSPSILKIIHSARQDLEVLTDIRGRPPAPVFDTQMAASLCGFDDQIGYGALVEAITGHKLPKLHTRADWEARPLPDEQLHYAEDDVRFLRDAYRFLAGKLEALGRTSWLVEDCATLTDPALYRNDPRMAFQRLRQGQNLAPASQMVLRELAAWREQAAQRSNLPRGWVAPDAVLLKIAQDAPHSIEMLSRISGLGSGGIRKWGEEILLAVRSGLGLTPERLWEQPRRLDHDQQVVYESWHSRIRTVATQLKISPTVLAPRRELLKLMSGDMSSGLARGWRRECIGEELLRQCGDHDGSAAVT
jgi:ribonuclease D